jgi:rhodanese-related sulfurtransferase
LLEALNVEGASVTLFDLRPPESVAADGLPGARPLSLTALQEGEVPEAPKDETVYLICERGAVSELAGLYLEAAGFSDVRSVTGGMKAYQAVRVAAEPQ